MSQHLHHKLAKLHESLLHGKLPRSLHWSDVVELIGQLGQIQAHAMNLPSWSAHNAKCSSDRTRPTDRRQRCPGLGNFLKKSGTSIRARRSCFSPVE